MTRLTPMKVAESFLLGEKYEITISPEEPSFHVIGEYQMGPNQDTIWIKVTSGSSGDCPWPWSYGLLTWVTENGRELGTVKVNGTCEGEVFRLGVGRPPFVRTGSLQFKARAYNTAWVKLGNDWPLEFEVWSGTSTGGIRQTPGAVVNSFVDTADNGLSLVRVNFP